MPPALDPADAPHEAHEAHDEACSDCGSALNHLLALRTQQESHRRLVHERRVLVLYGSETGNASSIAERVHALALDKGLNAHLAVLDDYEKLGLLESAAVAAFCIVVVSTTGNGDPPKGAEKLVRFVKKRTLAVDTLKGVAGFAVLALGDSNYDKFCFVGKQIDARFKSLGAPQLLPVTCADEVQGLDSVVEPWITKLWPILTSTGHAASPLGPRPSSSSITASPSVSQPNGHVLQPSPLSLNSLTAAPPVALVDPNDPFEPKGWLPPSPEISLGELAIFTMDELKAKTLHPARLLQPDTVVAAATTTAAAAAATTTTTTAAGSTSSGANADETFDVSLVSVSRTLVKPDRLVLKLGVSLPSGLEWLPGDALAVHVDNPSVIVRAVAARVGAEPPSDRDLVSPPPRTFLRLLAEHCADPLDCARLLFLSSAEGKPDFETLVAKPRATVAEILALFPSCRPSLATLKMLPPLKPRFYSLASSPLSSAPARVLVSVVSETVEGRRFRGLCSHMLNSMTTPTKLRCHLQRNPAFRVPEDESKPLIMVGPGTGVAPFVGFLEHRVRARKEAALSLKAAVPASGTWRGGLDFEDDLEALAMAEEESRRSTPGPVAVAEARLYYGCRNAEDHLCRAELEGLAAEGEVVLRVAFSRDPSRPKQYVQDLLAKDSAHLATLIVNRGAYVFVCGDGTAMAKQVLESFQSILVSSGALGGEAAQAKEYLKMMQAKGRYCQDIW